MSKGFDSKRECTSHEILEEKVKNRVNDLQKLFTSLQSARKESSSNGIVILEEQIHQILREWNAEFSEPSPASSSAGGSLGSFSKHLAYILDEDDASTAFVDPKAEACLQIPHTNYIPAFQDDSFVGQAVQPLSYFDFNESEYSSAVLPDIVVCNADISSQLDLLDFDLHQNFQFGTTVNTTNTTLVDSHRLGLLQEFQFEHFNGSIDSKDCGENNMPNILPNISPPPSAFLGPNCALWECFRPAQVSEWCNDYCSTCHSVLAKNEGFAGMNPIVRPGGIGLKDGPLFAALTAKSQGKEVGIPTCDGAATLKSPWNAPNLFDVSFLHGETLREWLFFDKPRRAFESGNRKQRSIPDYAGRGWHESRKQAMKEYDGQKRSYYMDPQPSSSYEWHLFEYEINDYNPCALYRLEFKHSNGKKSQKGKVPTDSLADLQKKMGRLTAEGPPEDSLSGKTKMDADQEPKC